MAKKLKGDFFFLSANDLKSGKVLFYSKSGWINDFKKAIKLSKKEIEIYEKIYKADEDKCKIIAPTFIEINENGEILKLRDKIRIHGLTIEI
tara:strand:- start:247 stop:522 length:276 start_codon:yes stop_codon:yes gene_type:complete